MRLKFEAQQLLEIVMIYFRKQMQAEAIQYPIIKDISD